MVWEARYGGADGERGGLKVERRDVLTKLADAGEEALSKLSESARAERLAGAFGGVRERLDELQKKVLGLDALEQRVADLERRVEASEHSRRRTPARGTAAKKPRATSARKTAGTSKPRAKRSEPEG